MPGYHSPKCGSVVHCAGGVSLGEFHHGLGGNAATNIGGARDLCRAMLMEQEADRLWLYQLEWGRVNLLSIFGGVQMIEFDSSEISRARLAAREDSPWRDQVAVDLTAASSGAVFARDGSMTRADFEPQELVFGGPAPEVDERTRKAQDVASALKDKTIPVDRVLRKLESAFKDEDNAGTMADLERRVNEELKGTGISLDLHPFRGHRRNMAVTVSGLGGRSFELFVGAGKKP